MARIFISYRRDDSSGHAGRLYDSLSARLGPDQLFMDIDTIKPGVDFVKVIEDAVSTCDVVLALIGRRWLTSADDQDRRRLNNPNDFVRLELATALQGDVLVIPLLVQGASMPISTDLPQPLQPLARRQAFELSDTRWPHDVGRLATILQETLQPPADTSTPASPSPPTPRQPEVRGYQAGSPVTPAAQRPAAAKPPPSAPPLTDTPHEPVTQPSQAARPTPPPDSKRQDAPRPEPPRQIPQAPLGPSTPAPTPAQQPVRTPVDDVLTFKRFFIFAGVAFVASFVMALVIGGAGSSSVAVLVLLTTWFGIAVLFVVTFVMWLARRKT